VIIATIILFLIGCTIPIQETGKAYFVENIENNTINITQNQSNKEINKTKNDETISTPCEQQWRCISPAIKALQLNNCSFSERVSCKNGCFNDTCIPSSTCTAGFKCINNNMRGYQLEDCDWISKSVCEWGCNNTQCNQQPNFNISNTIQNTTVAEPTTKPSPAPIPQYSLKEGTTTTIGSTNVSIYTFDQYRIKLLMNNRRSDWIMENGNITLPSGERITITEILFQQFEGGTRAISYTIQ